MMSIRWKEVIFPALALLWVAAYWSQLEGAPRAARAVPDGVMVFILVLAVVIILRNGMVWTGPKAGTETAEPGSGSAWGSLLGFQRELAFVGLSVGYYILFDYVGFHPANVVFLAVGLRVAGNPWRTVLAGTLVTSAVIFGVAELMQFNIPTPKFFR